MIKFVWELIHANFTPIVSYYFKVYNLKWVKNDEIIFFAIKFYHDLWFEVAYWWAKPVINQTTPSSDVPKKVKKFN